MDVRTGKPSDEEYDGGVLADRYDKRNLLVGAKPAMGAASAPAMDSSGTR